MRRQGTKSGEAARVGRGERQFCRGERETAHESWDTTRWIGREAGSFAVSMGSG